MREEKTHKSAFFGRLWGGFAERFISLDLTNSLLRLLHSVKNEDYSRDKIRATHLLSWRHSPLFDEPLVFTFPSSLKVLTEGDPLRQEIFRLQLVRAWRMRNRKEDAAVAEAISRVTKVRFLLVHLNFR